MLDKTAIKNDLKRYAKLCATITYSNLSPLHYRELAFFEILGQISREEHAAGRGMLTVLVVLAETERPANGFFELAEELYDIEIDDREAFYQQEKNKVCNAWKNK